VERVEEEARVALLPHRFAIDGSSVLRGSGAAVVYATGRRTEFGKVAALSVEVRRPPTPIEREVTRTVRSLTAVAVVMGLAFFAYGVAIGRPLWVNVVFMLGIIVANVPEGLLPTLTLALAMGGLRLARKKVLVKSLNAVEALGSVEVICTDKTGTLTKNELAVTSVVDALTGEPQGDGPRRALLEAAVAASEIHEQGGALTGDPLDVAAATALRRMGGDPVALSREVVRHIAFDVERRRAAGVLARGGSRLFAVKGAWEVVRPHLSLPPEALALGDAAVRRLASQGLRVIAVASRELAAAEVDAPEAAIEEGLELRGLLCLSDPLRDEVPDAVARCKEAGVRVILVTGDHPDTARAIAGLAGILPRDASADGVLTGDHLERMREDELVTRLRGGLNVFARTTPEQRLKIVGAVKRMGLLVAMTGDGVNDAPALRAADVGIRHGRGRHRRGAGGRADRAARRRFREHRGRCGGGAHRLRQHAQVHELRARQQRARDRALPGLRGAARAARAHGAASPLHRSRQRSAPGHRARARAARRRGHEAAAPGQVRAPARRQAAPAQLHVPGAP
jgi:sodium/potassium-transporting ATPase subunit alpha